MRVYVIAGLFDQISSLKELVKKISSYQKSCSNRSAQIGEFFNSSLDRNES
jgi:hypothetical protein